MGRPPLGPARAGCRAANVPLSQRRPAGAESARKAGYRGGRTISARFGWGKAGKQGKRVGIPAGRAIGGALPAPSRPAKGLRAFGNLDLAQGSVGVPAPLHASCATAGLGIMPGSGAQRPKWHSKGPGPLEGQRPSNLPQVSSIRRNSSTSSAKALSACISSEMRDTACITVVWSRLPKRRPISGSERDVSCFARYIAT